MNIKRFFVLSLFLALGMMVFAQETAGIMLNIMPEKIPTQADGMIVKYIEYELLMKSRKEKTLEKWTTLGSVEKPILFTEKSDTAKVVCRYLLKGWKFDTRYAFKVILVYKGKKGEISKTGVIVSGEQPPFGEIPCYPNVNIYLWEATKNNKENNNAKYK